MSRPLNPLRLHGANFRVQDLPTEVRHRAVVLVADDDAPSRAVLYWREGVTPRVGIHLMHPRTDQSQNYNIVALAQAGYAVLGRAGRWVNNDVDTVHETLMLDMAAGVRFLRDEVGCEQVVLVGNSGGGTLASMYQWQARTDPPGRLTRTAAGDPLDLNAVDLPPADGIAIIAGHRGEGEVLLKYIDPSVVDESDPVAADPELDMYHPANGFRTPPESSHYPDDFLERYRRAQRERVRRIDVLARSLVAQQKAGGTAADILERDSPEAAMRLRRLAVGAVHMVIYRTAADPAATDLGIEPDDRVVGSYLSKRPDLENYGGPGFARYITPRGWLSTWSGLSSRANTIACLQQIHDPLLFVHYAGDEGLRMSEAEAIVKGSAATDKELVVVRHADHYGRVINPDGSIGTQTTEGTRAIVDWITARFKN